MPARKPPKIEWPADKVSRRPIGELTPYARNSRTHTDEQVDQVAASIREWGWTMPVLVDEDGVLIAGHCRILAAQKLGIKDVPVVVAEGWDEAKKRAYVIADNKLALNAGWNTEMLASELEGLSAGDFDMTLLGFNDDELSELMGGDDGTAGLTDPDAVPEAEEYPVSVLGDVWILGHHRLVCGDSTDADTVAKCLDGVQPHLMVTDPPYGVEYSAEWRERAGLNGKGAATGKVLNDDRADWSEAWALFPGDVAYVWHASNMANTVADSLIACGLNIRAQIIWAKSQLVLGRGDYHPQHEPCWYAVRKNKPGQYNGGRKQTTLWQIDKPQKSETGHSTQKPIECMKRPIENNSSPGQAVYEPFSGSGTTIIAGEMTGRSIHAIELSPAYVDVAIKRWQDFTGEVAYLKHENGDRSTFAELAEERLPQEDEGG